MRLSRFIISNLEEILTQWEVFASTVLPGKQLDRTMLRDDAAEMLKTIAQDIETPQADREVQRSRPKERTGSLCGKA